MPNLARLLASAGLSLEPDAIDGETVTATVNTSSDALSLLASTEKVTLDIMNGDSILTDTSKTALKYAPLYTLDTEVKVETPDQNGEMQTTTKVVAKNLGVAVTKNAEPMLVWITGSDTFNRTQSELSQDEMKDYSVAMYGVSSLILWMGKTFESSLEDIAPVAYVPELLTIESKDITVIGVLVIGVLTLLMLGAGLLRIYLRKKRGRKVAV
jgi:hypothetical protein